MELKIQEADSMFKKLDEKLSPKFRGKIIALDTETGDYFIGNSELEAYKNAVKKYPNKQFVYKRIGFHSTHFVGAV